MSFRFAVLHHTYSAGSVRPAHWDLLLEQPDRNIGLMTFAVPVPPQAWGETTPVEQLPDHRSLYLDFQGPIAENRGEVARVLEGVIQWQHVSPELLLLDFQPMGLHQEIGQLTAPQKQQKQLLRISKPLDPDIEKGRWVLVLRRSAI